jgi:hypothetical protein
MSKTISKLMKDSQVALSNALACPELIDVLATYGYTPARLQEGVDLRDAAQLAISRKLDAFSHKTAVRDSYFETMDQVHHTYVAHRKIARVALRDRRAELQALTLDQRCNKTSQDKWYAQAERFYSAALSSPTVLTALQTYGLTSTQLEAGLASIRDLANEDAKRKHAYSVAQDACRQCDAALLELKNWMKDFSEIARIALRDMPHLLGQLELKPTRHKRAATPEQPSDPAEPTPVTLSAHTNDAEALLVIREQQPSYSELPVVGATTDLMDNGVPMAG